MKKIVSLLLSCFMFVCLIPSGVFAEDCEHVYSDWEIEYDATCRYEGLKTRECTLCGYLDEEVIEKTGEHKWNYYPTITASFDRDGQRRSICRYCREIKVNEIIPMISSIYLSQDTFVYDGTEKKPIVYVKDRNNNLVSEDNYKVYDLRRSDIGKHYVIVLLNVGHGYNNIYKKVYFDIVPKSPTNKNPIKDDNAFTARWSKISKKAASGYQVQYSKNANMTNAKKKNVAGATKTKVKIKKLKSKKKYYVRVRTYKKVNGKKVYSKWSAKKSVKTK